MNVAPVPVPLPLLDTEQFAITQPSTGTRRRWGRPVGTTYPDAPVVDAVIRLLRERPGAYADLRSAVREVAPLAYRWGRADPLSTVKRIERAVRAECSTAIFSDATGAANTGRP
jgi:hypothetical protein